MKLSTLLVIALAMASAQLSLAGCPDSKGFADCSGDKNPCALMRCKDGTVCTVDTCGGCHARCEEEGTMHIASMPEVDEPAGQLNSKPRPNSKPGLCPNGKAPVQCIADPCQTKNPCNNATEVCESNYCGGCNAVCKPKAKPNARPENSRPNAPIPKASTNATAAQCPDGSSFVNCLVDPCRNNGPCSKNQTCNSNYCGGCNAVCSNQTTDNTPNTTRPNSSPNRPTAVGPEPVDNPRPANSTCTRIPCGGIMCIRNTVCKNDWESCKAVCVPSEPSSNVAGPGQNSAPNGKLCSGVSPCAATTCLTNTMCVDDWTSCTAKCVKLCNKGFGWDAKRGLCRLCQPGFITDVQSNTCAACPKDTYFKFNLSGRSCMRCPQGTSTKGKTGQLRCVPA